MMNKNFALIALVLGFSVVANVQAADKRGTAKERVAALREAHPTALDQINELGQKPRHAAIDALEATLLGAAAVVEAPVVAVEDSTQTTLGWMQDKTVAGYESVKGQCVAHPKTAIVITAVSASTIALLADLKVRGNKSVLGQAWSRLSRKSAQTDKYNTIAQLIAAKQS